MSWRINFPRLSDSYIINLSYGRKGVGSQGDGTVQVLAKDENFQKLIKEYFEEKLGMHTYTLTLPETKPVKKAIIPVVDNGIIKPVILCLIEEIVKAGIEEECLIIDSEDKKEYDKLFNDKLSNEVVSKLSPELLEYESFIQKIGKK